MKLSATRIKMYLTCPRQFKYAYVDELPTEPTDALAFGQIIHRTLHELHLHSAEIESPLDFEYAFAVFEQFWREEMERHRSIFTTESAAQSYWSLGDGILRRYVEAHKVAEEPLVLEFPFDLTWRDPRGEEHRLAGIVDRVNEGPQGLIIVDYKSGKRKPKADSIGSDLQLLLYAFAIQETLGEPVNQIAILHLRDGTLLQAAPSPDNLQRLVNEVLPNVVRGIQAKRFAPHYGYWCRYCDYKTRCDAQGPDEPVFSSQKSELASTH
jgi:putative RecB family exonuclease